ncbi:MAG TPA: hypothetical protein VE621_03915 [Bryobacteraceae bacterium]|nr:hypothetical protein [Bryobacteraceae bacterium]
MRGSALFLTLSMVFAADVLDRVAVTIAMDVITESEIREQIRISALQNGDRPDYSPENRRATAEKMVEQYLLRRELESLKLEIPVTNAQIDQVIQSVISERYPSKEAFEEAKNAYNISDVALRRQIQWQLTLIPFIDSRFRPSVPVPNSEVREYYDNVFLPQWQEENKGREPPAFESVQEEIEKLLLNQRADQALDRWLGQARTQQRIRYFDEAFR